MNRVRCTNCRSYFDRGDAVWHTNVQYVCSDRCLLEYFNKKRRRSNTPRVSKAPKIPVAVRYAVKERDDHRCVWCSQRGTQCHHVIYRSTGGPDLETNLALLCAGCHAKAHSSKEAFQPLLLAYLWLRYVEGIRLTIPEVARRLDGLGLLSELQHRRLAG